MSAVLTVLLVASQVLTTEQQIESRYAAWDSAYRRHDVIGLASLLHPRFRIVTESGKQITRAKYLQGLWKDTAPESYRTTLLKVQRAGSRVSAWTEEHAQHKGEAEHVHRYKDTWALRSGHWRLLESRTLEEK